MRKSVLGRLVVDTAFWARGLVMIGRVVGMCRDKSGSGGFGSPQEEAQDTKKKGSCS